MRYQAAGIALVLPFVTVACGRSERPVPRVVGERLDVAEHRLDARGLSYDVIGGGTFGVVVKSNWRVCEQEPAPGAQNVNSARLIVDRDC